ncbi:rhodanese-like domain-containing protein [Dokdonia sp. Hel_I_53]|uniref:rhodanese-like domain-containing protein n=1 Tax=Dokdonia sp. Hel_I_53 TaxID=1566287 RepID=UPI00119A31F9|nr:rhodanese-like domain-containing protein [Dokdonia sp. Hel_I_53]TVZ51891.1 rhodanese-related sulfurtransferase [Dokdonia sp. Hel_I_53]
MKVFKLVVATIIAFSLSSCQESISKTQKMAEASSAQKAQTSNVELVGVQSFASAIEGDNIQLIDVRTESEWQRGHIEGARHFEMKNPDWDKQVETLDKELPVYVYCAKGGRSAFCAQQLKDAGFKQIIDLEGGVTAWEAAGKSLK